MHRSLATALLLIAALCPLAPATATHGQRATADVVVIVDTSTSMREPGMDPERTSLLVTKLLSDIVPGDLTVVRLLDLVVDQQLLPRTETGRTEPCPEDPSQLCGVIEPATDWEADARSGKYGALQRPARGDAGFKTALEGHLEQRIHNSPFNLAFRAAQGIFDDHQGRTEATPRTVIWLSDGRPDHEPLTRRAVADLLADGIAVEAIVFGRGDPRVAREAGLPVEQAASPAGLMKAFAGAFRRIVQAPYELDGTLAAQPSFEMKPHVDEAWVVVYGDDSLREATLDGPQPQGTVAATYATERWPGAGAYRVAYIEQPAPGWWTVRTTGGGHGVAYAVVQRSALSPTWIEPREAVVGAEVPLVVGIRAGLEGDLITDPEVLQGLRLTAEVEGETLAFHDEGSTGDERADDGRFTVLHTFRTTGTVPVTVHLTGEIVGRNREATVDVGGVFRLTGGPEEVDLGTVVAGQTTCRVLDFEAEHIGAIPFTLANLRPLPPGLRLEVRPLGGTLNPGDPPLPVAPGEAIEVCLVTSEQAPSSTASGEPWLVLAVAGSQEAHHRLEVSLVWRVLGLTFWQRWGRLILSLLGVLILVALVLGFVLPHRFQPGLAVVFAPERADLDEQTPQPVRQWKGVGIGFYRNARAFLHGDFRLSGDSRGALASLQADKRGAQIAPGKGTTLSRETLDGDWETVATGGRRARGGDVYRISDKGPFFRISSRGGTR